jgi:hypothetical protein
VIDSFLRGAVLLEDDPLILRLVLWWEARYRMISNITYKKWPFLQLVRDIVQMVLHTTLELIILELPDEIEINVRRVRCKYLLTRL